MKNVAFFFSAISTQGLKKRRGKKKANDEDAERAMMLTNFQTRVNSRVQQARNGLQVTRQSYWIALTTPNGAPSSPLVIHRALLECNVDVFTNQVDPSFNSSLSLALGKLHDAKLVIDQFGFQSDGPVIRGNETVDEQARLSDKLTVLVNDIGIAMKKLGYALYGGKVYKKCDKAKYTYWYKCEVEAFVNSLAANHSFEGRLLKDMKKVIEILANPHCEVIRPLCVDYNLIEVNEGQCWSVKERRFLENAIEDKDIGRVTPRAFFAVRSDKRAGAEVFQGNFGKQSHRSRSRGLLRGFPEALDPQPKTTQRQSTVSDWRCQ
ncbi:hypothetical protein OS493_011193 [Desmophyllum pertusum]|uniref:Uncharacterized protein n=1 Tax=Desmophyllum pertusum TaxID=174260 RepID=A0A9X0CTG3_9CNID|nr:hypothetical protein OS493_011193 [Desmophyllum pertusum]